MSYGSGNNPNLVKTAVDEVLYSAYDYPRQPGFAGAENALLFNQQTIDRGAVITMEYQPPGKFETEIEEEERKLATVRTANSTTRNVSKWTKTLKIPMEFYEDDLHDSVNKTIQMVGFRARTTQDENAMDIYAGGFDTTTTNDSAYLWSNSHTNLNGDTIDNLETGVFNGDNMETLVRKLMEQKGQDGEAGSHIPVAFLVPPILFPDANEILKSELKANVTDNNLNYFSLIYPGLQIFESIFVGGTYHAYTNANTSHYLVSQNHSIMRWVRIPLETQLVPPDTDDRDRWTYKARYREVCGAISWEGAVASNGTV